jgi:8-oxo-dGTP pyrophosphatase MutT (NUDIX family)
MAHLEQVAKAPKSTELKQFGVLPLMKGSDGAWRVILITSRDSGRWTIPKGNPIKGKKPHEAAAVEAEEEAGLLGDMSKDPIGAYEFFKRREGSFELANVTVYCLKVKRQLSQYKEKGIRKIEAFLPEDAEDAVVEPGLKALIRQATQKKAKG